MSVVGSKVVPEQTRGARLQRLLVLLRERDQLPVGPREEAAAFQTLMALPALPDEPGGPAGNERLRAYIRPILAKSAREAEMFDARFNAVFGTTAAREDDLQGDGKPGERSDTPRVPPRIKSWRTWIAVATFVAVVATLAYQFASRPKSPPSTAPAVTESTPTMGPSAPEDGRAGDAQREALSKARESPAANQDRAAATSQPVISWWLFSFLVALPSVGGVAWLLLLPGRRRAHLRRLASGGAMRVHHVEVMAEAARELGRVRQAIIGAARVLHGRAEIPSSDLDVERTALATIRNGGCFSPVWAPRRVTPEYLVLIVSAGPDDHQAERMSWLMQQVAGEEVTIERFFIEHNANRAFKKAGDRRVTLKQLFDRYPRHRLIVMGTGELFFRAGMQRVWPWAHDVRLWDIRVMITPFPATEWGAREARLAGLFGAPVYPATSEGLRELGAWLQGHAGVIEERPATNGLPARSWHFDPGRWLTQAPADAESEWRTLRSELAGYLDEAGLEWLRACAVYPALRWDLTVFLGLKLTGPAPGGASAPLFSEARATRLCLLPWFQAGFLPDWLRRRLIAELNVSRRKEITDLIAWLLAGAGQQASGRTRVTLPIAVRTVGAQSEGAHQEWPTEDAVFLEYVERQGADALSVPAPESLARRLLGPSNRFRRREQSVLVGWGAVTLLALVALPKPWEPPKAVPAPAPETASISQPKEEAPATERQAEPDPQPTARTAEAATQLPPQEPVLRIDPGMHTATIRRIGVDAACTLLATGSYDKTVRLWRLPDGRPVRTLRPPIGPGNEGRIYAVAMAPDASWLAAGGWTGAGGAHWVYVFETATGRMLARLGAFSGVVDQLAISPDGAYVAALIGGQGLQVWRRRDWATIFQERYDSGQPSYAAGFDRAGALFIAGADGKLRRYAPDFRLERSVQVPGGLIPYSLAVDAGSGRLALGFNDPRVVVYDAAMLQTAWSPDTQGVLGSLGEVAWSSDGTRLFAGGEYAGRDGRRLLRMWSSGGSGRPTDFEGPADTIMHVVTCGDSVMLGAADPAFGALAGSGAKQFWRDRVTPDMRGKVGSAFATTPDGSAVQFGLRAGAGELVEFDLGQGRLDDARAGRSPLQDPNTSGLSVTDWQNALAPKLAGQPIRLQQYETSRALAVSANRQRFVLGADWSLNAYDREGRTLWRRDTPGVAWGVNIPEQGRLVVAAYGDGTVRWHRLADGQELLALFVHANDRRWVAWTPRGYYMASPGGEELIGWHVNRDGNEAADFFPASRFRDQFHRPDIVRLALSALDEEVAIAEANKAAGRARAREDIRTLMPPIVTILSPADGAEFRTSEITLEYRFRSSAGASPVTNVRVLVDGALVRTSISAKVVGGAGAPGERDALRVALPPRDVTLSLVASTAESESAPASIRLRWAGPVQPDRSLEKAAAERALEQLQELLGDSRGRVRVGIRGGNRVPLGAEIVFTVQSQVAGSLLLIDINANGEIVQIFPNQYSSSSRAGLLAPGREIVVPGPDYGFRSFRATEPVGQGKLVALVVPANFLMDALVDKKVGAKGFAPIEEPASYLSNLIRTIRRYDEKALAGWALAMTDYEIVAGSSPPPEPAGTGSRAPVSRSIGSDRRPGR